MNSTQETADILIEANEKKALRLEQARINYTKRKDEGRLKKKLIPKEEQQKRGPKAPETPKPEPKTRGRKQIIINNVAEIPAYINKLIKTEEQEPAENTEQEDVLPFNIFINDGLTKNKFECIDSCIETDSRETRDLLIKLINISVGKPEDAELEYETGDIYRRIGTNIIYFRVFLDNGARVIKYNLTTKKYIILIGGNMNTFIYNKNKFKNILSELVIKIFE